mgnify:CR=1 FL=1
MAGAGERPHWQHHTRRQRLVRFAGLLVALIVFAWAWQALDVRYDFVRSAPAEVQDLLVRMYPPDTAYSTEIVGPLIETVNIAVLGTGLSVLFSVPIAYLAAENTSPTRLTYLVGKLVVTVTRSVSVIIWALLFVVIFGPGPLAGVVAIGVRSVGFIGKLLAEAIEEIDPRQPEAIRATGGSPLDVLIYGIVPQVKPAFVGITTYRWDINVRSSTVLGFVGAGGIGAELFAVLDFFRWDAALTILIAILGIVLLSEAVSAVVRGTLR